MLKNNDGPAFPQHKNGVGGQTIASVGGMSLRDYFAGQAVAGLSADPDANVSMSFDAMAEWSFNLADAMLAAREASND